MSYENKIGLPEDWEKLFPSSNVNNTRAYVRKIIQRFIESPSEMLAHLLENLIPGICIDHSDGDWGTGERGEPN